MPREIMFNEVEVISKVVNLFWQKGYSGTSMQDLSTVTGLNRSSIYNSFGNKKELYRLALKTYQKMSAGLFQKALLKSKDSKEALQFIFSYLVDVIVEDTDNKGCFNMNCKSEMSQKEDAIKSYLDEIQATNLLFFEGLIAGGQKEGLFNTDKEAVQYAHYLYSSFQGMKMTGILIKDRMVLASIAEDTLKVLN